MKQGLCNTRHKVWTTQETTEDEEPKSCIPLRQDPSYRSQLQNMNFVFFFCVCLHLITFYTSDQVCVRQSFLGYVASADDLWIFVCVRTPADECERSVWERTGRVCKALLSALSADSRGVPSLPSLWSRFSLRKQSDSVVV